MAQVCKKKNKFPPFFFEQKQTKITSISLELSLQKKIKRGAMRHLPLS